MQETKQLLSTGQAALTITELIDSYKSGQRSVTEHLQQLLVSAQQDTNNAWISTIEQRQLDNYLANLSEHDIDDLPLFGVPFAIKDNIDLDVLPTTAGCKAFTYQPESSAFVVELLIAAGAVPLGKTNLDQFATGLVGTRSPYGEAQNSFDNKYISGGSSAGSAVSVAKGQVMFSLGTDTAGSGRVPAAFNNLYGLKPSKGLLSCRGVVPACRSLDCVTLFSHSADDLSLLLSIVAKYDQEDCYARIAPQESITEVMGSMKGVRVGIPAAEQLAFFGNDEYMKLYQQAVQNIEAQGAKLVAFDLSPFLEAASLLYNGPWVAERYAAIEAFFDTNVEECLPVIQQIVGGATGISAADTFKAMYQLQAYKVECDKLMHSVDVVMTPTAGTIYTIDEVNADPIKLNSNLGYYTNFMNLLDYSAIAIPAGFTNQGLPFGVTLFAPAFSDQKLLSLAGVLQLVPSKEPEIQLNNVETIDIMVCGAHMQGLPLNHQLLELGGSLRDRTKTSDNYQLFKLAGGLPMRPGMVRNEAQGTCIDVEVWTLPRANLGDFLLQIPHPLGLGSVELNNGEWVKGFICEPIAIKGAQDVTGYGGWRDFLEALEQEAEVS
ncbi:allophanate hydrolase [Vibrio superstes]|uniref:Allophanate hydrolase n=1 Tax=Vibrio superstes NBRC 103154 TaxID=1219062 RepID=A0A511QQM0_9VIBR|nr:allophanate hydrolase [Vibrio superstes]GEM78852.1 allophanate hydrolase [Vibrio superstes NBRC 103154]